MKTRFVLQRGILLSLMLLVVVSLTLGCAANRASAASILAKKTPSDGEISAAVEDEILFDVSVPLNDIQVSTTQGVVTLTGSVNNLLAKERAARIAETARGVRSVINRIQVTPFWG